MTAVAIQAHQNRREMAEALAARVDAAVVWDPLPDHPVRSAWRTYREALQGAPAGCSRLAVLQDDAQPCPHFRETLEAAEEVADPDGLLCLFVSGASHWHKLALDRACAEDRTLVRLEAGTWVPVVATVWPVTAAARVLGWVDEQGWSDGFTCDDEIVGRATAALGIPVYATMPSLVDHPDDTASIVASSRQPLFGINRDRVAYCYVGDDSDPRAISWRL